MCRTGYPRLLQDRSCRWPSRLLKPVPRYELRATSLKDKRAAISPTSSKFKYSIRLYLRQKHGNTTRYFFTWSERIVWLVSKTFPLGFHFQQYILWPQCCRARKKLFIFTLHSLRSWCRRLAAASHHHFLEGGIEGGCSYFCLHLFLPCTERCSTEMNVFKIGLQRQEMDMRHTIGILRA